MKIYARLVFAAWASSVALALFTLIAQGQQDEPARPDGQGSSPQQGTAVAPPAIDQVIENDEPPFFVRADVNHASRNYREGETLSIEVVAEQDAWIYVAYQQADGKVFQIFPNSVQPKNRILAKQLVRIAAGDDLFRWIVGPPFGKEIVKVVASREPLKSLAPPELRAKRFNPLSAGRLKTVVGELEAAEPAGWAECDIEIHTRAAVEPAAEFGPKRWGVFFGVSKYEFDAVLVEWREKHPDSNTPQTADDEMKKPQGLNTQGTANSAKAFGELLNEVGRLDGQRVYVDQQATRAAMEEAITEWLPRASRPGDTVFIFFAGHGDQLPDDNDDEQDRLDEFLLPHDFVPPEVLLALAEKGKAGQLDAALVARLDKWAHVVQQAGEQAVQAGATADAAVQAAMWALVRATGVTDDLFAHWLQKLDGRQVVVIVDACHSGGLATAEKGVRGRSVPKRFDFIAGELARLKDIGGCEQALLAACGRGEQALDGPKLSLMTACLLTSIAKPLGAVKLEDSYEFCRSGLAEFFEDENRKLRASGKEPLQEFHPFFLNNCTKPVFLKP